MSDLLTSVNSQVRNQTLNTAHNVDKINHRSTQVFQANTEKLQQEIKLPFALYSEAAQNELKKRELLRKDNKIQEVNKNTSGMMSMLKDLPLTPPKIKRRLRAIEKAYEKLFKKLGKIFKRKSQKKPSRNTKN